MTSTRRLVFLGGAGEEPSGETLHHEGRPLSPGEALPLERKRSPWNAHRGVERVIVGSHPARADVLLEGPGIRPEHVRLYFPLSGAGPADLLPIEGGETKVLGRAVGSRDWTALEGGEELELGRWRFRYERGAEAAAEI